MDIILGKFFTHFLFVHCQLAEANDYNHFSLINDLFIYLFFGGGLLNCVLKQRKAAHYCKSKKLRQRVTNQ